MGVISIPSYEKKKKKNGEIIITKLELVTVKVPWITIFKLIPEHFDIDFMDSSEVTHNEVKQNTLFRSIFPLHQTPKPLRILHSIVGRSQQFEF